MAIFVDISATPTVLAVLVVLGIMPLKPAQRMTSANSALLRGSFCSLNGLLLSEGESRIDIISAA